VERSEEMLKFQWVEVLKERTEKVEGEVEVVGDY